MLARHLLFLATRRPNNTFLAIQPNEPVSSSAYSQQQQQQQKQQQPPPYIGPPHVPKLHEDYPNQVVYDNRFQQHESTPSHHGNKNLPANNHQQYNHQTYQHHRKSPGIHNLPEPYLQFIYKKSNLDNHCQHQNYSNHAENERKYAHQFQNCQKNQQRFYTLPSRRPSREIVVDPPRSITPDITRGLTRGPPSAMHMLARQGQKSDSAERLIDQQYGQSDVNSKNLEQLEARYKLDLNQKNLEQFEASCKLAAQEQQRHTPVDVKNRFASPLGLSALGYRLLASPIQDNLKLAPLSPIGPGRSNGFKSSTPTSRATTTVVERLALQTQRCASPNPSILRHATSETQLLSSPPCDSGRSTPTGLVLSPIKSTMSNEELFAAIHKSKRRLNIRDDPESLSPVCSLTSLIKGQQHTIGTRHSWSPESQKLPEIPKTIVSPSTTSRMDFKRLLLQQSIKTGPTRISAAEQLKLTRQQCQESQQQSQQQQHQCSSKLGQQTALTKVLSPRSAWRFQTPRTDVLSSTIIEDAAAEEKAMNSSPETPVPSQRLIPDTVSVRRQLEIDGIPQRLGKSEKELENRLQAVEAKRSASTDELSSPIKAFESRRMSNQLARAQFLASPAAPKDLYGRRFRARSESPQQNIQRNKPSETLVQIDVGPVTRSPSAPTLETAL